MKIGELQEEIEGQPEGQPVFIFDMTIGKMYELHNAEFKPVLYPGGAFVLEIGREVPSEYE